MSGDQPEVAALAAARIRRQPEPPLTLDEFEREIMASDAPLVRPVARDLMRALLRGCPCVVPGVRMPQAAIFDVDGTLVDFVHLHASASSRRSRPSVRCHATARL